MIGYAEQKGSNVFVYNTNGGFLWNRTGTLMGYTSSTVTIKQGSTIMVCGERRNQVHQIIGKQKSTCA